MISAGMVLGGPEHVAFDREVRSFMRFCRENRSRGFARSEINIVYHVPGSLGKPDYVGVRTGRFSKKENCLMVQVAVEEEFASLDDAKKIRQYIFETADEAIGVGKSYLERKGLDYEIEIDRAILEAWLAEGANV
jgi:hypothetical protein